MHCCFLQILSLADCMQYMPDVLSYVDTQLIPYYQTSLSRCQQLQMPTQQPTSSIQDGTFQEQLMAIVRRNVSIFYKHAYTNAKFFCSYYVECVVCLLSSYICIHIGSIQSLLFKITNFHEILIQ